MVLKKHDRSSCSCLCKFVTGCCCCFFMIRFCCFAIQPLIENAIIYGLRSDSGEMRIDFSILEVDNQLRIEIKNELNMTTTKNHSFQSKSTEIIQKRLALYDSSASIKTVIQDQFFIATIVLPINE